jgi:hypothetical protein
MDVAIVRVLERSCLNHEALGSVGLTSAAVLTAVIAANLGNIKLTATLNVSKTLCTECYYECMLLKTPERTGSCRRAIIGLSTTYSNNQLSIFGRMILGVTYSRIVLRCATISFVCVTCRMKVTGLGLRIEPGHSMI